jgi:hypothetical protein
MRYAVARGHSLFHHRKKQSSHGILTEHLGGLGFILGPGMSLDGIGIVPNDWGRVRWTDRFLWQYNEGSQLQVPVSRRSPLGLERRDLL